MAEQAQQVRSLADEVEAAVAAAMGEALPAELANTDPLVRRSDRADFQSNAALPLARRTGLRPRDLAATLRDRLAGQGLPWLTSVEVSGPGFLNISLSDAALLERLAARLADPRLGVPPTQTSQRVVVDYSAPNVARELHVGHLRSTLIGDALVRVLGFLGAEVVRQNHIGDWGTQFGMLIQHILERPGWDWRTEGVSALQALYRSAQEAFNADPAFKERAQRRVVALQAGDEESTAVWREIVGESQRAFQRVYERLGVLLTPEDVKGESFYNPWLNDVVAELRDKGILQESQGALVVFFDDILGPDDQPVPLLVRKRDGGFGYAATDLATIRYSIRELKGTRLLYAVDARQAQHFEMVFRTARRAGWLTDGTEAVHVKNGTVNGPDGRPFRTRAGGTVRLADLLDDALDRARQIIAERETGLAPAELEEIARVASVGAVKYAELSTSRLKDYAFDVARMVSFSGQTGVYLQYTHTRISSILRRSEAEAKARARANATEATPRFVPDVPLQPVERALALLLDEFAATLNAVAATLEPHRLAAYLYALAKAFTDFYESCPVLKADTPGSRANRLALCHLTRATLARGLGLLGITAPERM
ncbi:arginine--tRNA ligase [Streptomyces sp. 6N223]|uniref:arginine--tRNA ligase n=1 Tax=Streptomyces sp. 6N223 TaxID=3457412 RepID=UPI003FD4E255